MDNRVAVLIAVCAVSLTAYQAHVINRTQHLSVLPYVGISFRQDEDGAGWTMTNWGVGPAKIRTFEVLVDGKPQPHWRAVGAALGLPRPARYESTVPSPGSIELPEITSQLFWIGRGPVSETLTRNRERVIVRLCYCSLFDDCWVVTDREGEPKRGSCEAAPAVPFEAYPAG